MVAGEREKVTADLWFSLPQSGHRETNLEATCGARPLSFLLCGRFSSFLSARIRRCFPSPLSLSLSLHIVQNGGEQTPQR